MDLDCDLVIPCRDEAAALPGVMALVPDGIRVIVVDNGSTDGTAEVAASLGARVVHEARPGYGAAVHSGIEAATAQFVAVLDGDGSMDPRELLPLLEEVRSGAATMDCFAPPQASPCPTTPAPACWPAPWKAPTSTRSNAWSA